MISGQGDGFFSDEQIAEQVAVFKLKYLASVMDAAEKNGEDPYIAIFSLLEITFELLQLNMQTEEGAIEMFEALTATYARNWKAQI